MRRSKAKIRVPAALSSQIAIVLRASDGVFAARVAEIRAMKTLQGASRRRLDDLFASLLHRAFQGELP